MNSRMNLKRWAPVVLVALILAVGLSVFAAPPKKKTTKKKPKVVKTDAAPVMPIGTDTPTNTEATPPAAPEGAAPDAAAPAAAETPAAPAMDPDQAAPVASNAPVIAPSMDLQLRAMPDNTSATPAAAPAPAPAEVSAPAPAPAPEEAPAAPAPVAAPPEMPSKPAASMTETKMGGDAAPYLGSFNVPSQDSPDVQWWRDSQTNLDQRLAWFRDARFGMFIHWGVYSGLGNEFHGKKGGGYAEHIQRVLKIPIVQYRKEVAGNFNPTKFNADEWVRLAHDAGMKYIVITAKHHDGFAMWPTKINDYNVMDATPWHHDPMADLKAACDKYGLKFGFYYSQAFDWGNSNAPGNDWDVQNPGGDKKLGGTKWWDTKPEFLASARKYVDTKAIPQLQELIRMYHPAILWFDTSSKLPPSENLRIMKAVREADPNVVISGRLVNNWGDYDDTTDRPANFPPHDGDWEGIPTTDESYGWNPFDNSHKPPSHFIQLIAKAAARGGNTLLNIGPMGNGEIDPKDVSILKGIGDWWRVNGESIRGSVRTPLPVQAWGESTIGTNKAAWKLSDSQGAKRIYLHVFDWPASGQLVIGGLKSDYSPTALLLSDIDRAMHGTGAVRDVRGLKVVRINPSDVAIVLPKGAPDTADSVVVLTANDIQGDTNRLLQPEFSHEVLRAFDGDMHGLKTGPGKKTDDTVIDWTTTSQWVSWPVRLSEPASYDVYVNYNAATASVGGTYRITLGDQALDGTIESGTNRVTKVGHVALNPGNFAIKVAAVKINGGESLRLRHVELRSAQ